MQHMFRTLPMTIAPNHRVNNPASLLLLARLLAGYRRSNLSEEQRSLGAPSRRKGPEMVQTRIPWLLYARLVETTP